MEKANAEENTAARKPTILFVEDNMVLLKTYEQMFSSVKELKAFQWIGYDSAEKALRWLNQNATEDKPAAIVLDWIMEGAMDGLDLLKALKQDPRWKDVPVIMATSNRERAQVVKARASGAEDYVVKPIDTSVLTQKLGKWTSRRGEMKPAAA